MPVSLTHVSEGSLLVESDAGAKMTSTTTYTSIVDILTTAGSIAKAHSDEDLERIYNALGMILNEKKEKSLMESFTATGRTNGCICIKFDTDCMWKNRPDVSDEGELSQDMTIEFSVKENEESLPYHVLVYIKRRWIYQQHLTLESIFFAKSPDGVEKRYENYSLFNVEDTEVDVEDVIENLYKKFASSATIVIPPLQQVEVKTSFHADAIAKCIRVIQEHVDELDFG